MRAARRFFCGGRQPRNRCQFGDTRVSIRALPTGNIDERKGRELYVSGIMVFTSSIHAWVVAEADDDSLMLNGGYEGVNISTHLPLYLFGYVYEAGRIHVGRSDAMM